MQPNTAPIQVTENDRCCTCEGPLNGNRLNCPSCVQATERAIEEAAGRTVLPAMIAERRPRPDTE